MPCYNCIHFLVQNNDLMVPFSVDDGADPDDDLRPHADVGTGGDPHTDL